MISAATGAQAGLIGVTDIRITSAILTWLQVSEVAAIRTSDSMDAALASQGAVATSSGFGFAGLPSFAINGIGPNSHTMGEFHSDTPDFGEFLNIALSGPTELDSITIFGRTDCCSGRDLYNLQLLDTNGMVLFAANNLDARGSRHQVTVALPDTSNNQIPEGASLAWQ